jgi:hypothetical protein
MLTVINTVSRFLIVMLNVVMLSVVGLSVVEPILVTQY